MMDSTNIYVPYKGHGVTIVTLPNNSTTTEWVRAKRRGGHELFLPSGFSCQWFWPSKGIKVEGRVGRDEQSGDALFHLLLLEPVRGAAECSSPTSPQVAANQIVQQLIGHNVLSANTRLNAWNIFGVHLNSEVCDQVTQRYRVGTLLYR